MIGSRYMIPTIERTNPNNRSNGKSGLKPNFVLNDDSGGDTIVHLKIVYKLLR